MECWLEWTRVGCLSCGEESVGHVVPLAKLKRGKPEAGIVFRAGQTVRVRLGSGGDLVQLVISFTTPSRYYRAGNRVTTCLVCTPREAYASQVRGRRGAGVCLRRSASGETLWLQ